MAIADSTTNQSAHRALYIALPLGAHCAGFPHPSSTPRAESLLRAIATNAGVLPDVAPGGDHFVVVALQPYLLQALAAHLPPAPQPMPLFPGRT